MSVHPEIATDAAEERLLDEAAVTAVQVTRRSRALAGLTTSLMCLFAPFPRVEERLAIRLLAPTPCVRIHRCVNHWRDGS
jgi:hypothetical protein